MIDSLRHPQFRPTWRIVALAVPAMFASPAGIATGQTSGPADELRVGEGVRLLADVEDGAFAFDDEGFYWFCQFLRDHPDVFATSTCASEDAVPWRYLMERPSDYRGEEVCIEGRLLREQPEYEVRSRPGLGRLRQIDLGESGSQAIATLVLVDPPPTARRKSLIRARAFFIKVRSFRSEAGVEGAGPLLVARSFEVVRPAGGGGSEQQGPDGRRILMAMAGVTFVLFLLVITMRRRAGAVASGDQGPSRERLVTGTREDFEWLADGAEPPDHGSQPRM
ncbi:MAG TPA: hypothetical protein P5081_01940 [Phycisphaerae bacterium]|nr:hypothetical protein [Phycisphaerae bacterium]HRW51616.1 hypothetical protein [Phycisphaerae bacterium]